MSILKLGNNFIIFYAIRFDLCEFVIFRSLRSNIVDFDKYLLFWVLDSKTNTPVVTKYQIWVCSGVGLNLRFLYFILILNLKNSEKGSWELILGKYIFFKNLHFHWVWNIKISLVEYIVCLYEIRIKFWGFNQSLVDLHQNQNLLISGATALPVQDCLSGSRFSGHTFL